MQFSTLLISAATLIPSVLGCMNVSVVYTFETQFEQSNLLISYLDNGRVTCYYNQRNPSPESDTQVPLGANPGKDVVNDTVQGCVDGYESNVKIDLKSTSDKKKHNYIDFYRYTPEGIHSETTSYNTLYLGDREDNPASWSWTTAFFC
ncbi:uncharacterized protein EAE98_010570 [Botrytis deweyae]|uniref:AA1-like domain-containing protein n=1 Tax=Botrytis deweyae TaxID=2478750 RepID=A0ABQ7I845_9HELO|nr:uncharacterized protein EAE98_010570 [Botrytis deweyae]KAF7916561.1 hypothetical protein EAE98_010570 [Botrytis deweyae]